MYKLKTIFQKSASVVTALAFVSTPLVALLPSSAYAAGTVTVTINKYIDGIQATAISAQSNSFPMSATWNDATSSNTGTGSYTLDSTQAPAYQAQTIPFSSGSDYSTNEVVGGAVVGASCATGQPYALLGYTTGTTSAAAAAGTPSMTVPAFSNMTTDQFVIVWNQSCTAAPTVTAISPTTGTTTGGTTVTITGTDLTGTTAVQFGSTPATGVTNVSSTSVTAISPAEAAGTVDVTVTTPSGTSATSSADQFTYVTPSPSAPVVTAISPTTGTTTGGTTVTITGTDLTGTTAVQFGSTPATGVTNVSSTSVTAISPAEAAGTVDVTVTTPSGTSATSSADQFTYTAATSTPTVHVTIDKYIDGAMATASSSTSHSFTMNASWNDPSGVGSGTGQFTLNGSTTPAYEATSTAFNAGSDYSTNEVMGAGVGSACTTATTSPQFGLVGYTTGNTLAEAQAGTPTTTPATFSAMTQDKFVIVWNVTCGTGVLGVPPGKSAVEPVDTDATADGTFAHGWKYIFNITVPTSESGIAMQFSNWFDTANSTSFSVANNMRISSPQANNGGATVSVTGANTYTTPDLHIVGDMSSTTPGMQAQIVVEVAVPVGTPNGSYSTNYSIRSE